MTIAQLLFARPINLLDIDVRDARLVLAARSWSIFRRARQDPLPRISGYLQSGAAAMRMALLMDAITQVWPEPFAVHRPCCAVASIDELLLVNMVRLAGVDARPAFDTLLQEMLTSESRDLLFARARMLYPV